MKYAIVALNFVGFLMCLVPFVIRSRWYLSRHESEANLIKYGRWDSDTGEPRNRYAEALESRNTMEREKGGAA